VALSRIVTTEIIQLMPRRAASVTVSRTNGNDYDLKVALTGTFLQPDEAAVDACIRPNRTRCYARLEERTNGWWGPTARFATLGTPGAIPAERAGPGDWIPVSDPKPLTGGSGSRSRDTFTIAMKIQPRPGRQYSVFLEEWEPTVDWKGGDTLSDTTGCACGEGRLVYADRLLVRFD
jgi:hypothetical protein